MQVEEAAVNVGQDNENEDEAVAGENWIPSTAYNLAHNFRERHGDELSTELVNEMLRDLNRIYRDREKK